MVTLADIPSAAQLIRESRTAEMFYRELSGDRPMLSANDWYGFGFICGITGTRPNPAQYMRWYCGEKGAREQFRLGKWHAEQLNEAP